MLKLFIFVYLSRERKKLAKKCEAISSNTTCDIFLVLLFPRWMHIFSFISHHRKLHSFHAINLEFPLTQMNQNAFFPGVTWSWLSLSGCDWERRRQTICLMNRTIAVYVRYKSLYISLSFSAKWPSSAWSTERGLGTTTANFSYFHLELNAVVA